MAPNSASKSPPPVPKKPAVHSKSLVTAVNTPTPKSRAPVIESKPSASAPEAKAAEVDSKLTLLRRPLCIICGRPSEAKAIAEALGIDQDRVSGHEVDGVNEGHTFYLGSFHLGGNREEKLDYYITSSLRQGIQSFSIHASILFHNLRPRYAIHAGVCAAYADPDPQKRLKLKDVIISEAALNYEEGKWTDVDGKSTFLPDFDISRTPTGDMQAFADSRPIPTFGHTRASADAEDPPHYYRFGDFISGSAVRQDGHEIFKKIRSTVDRNAIGLDMEASAFLKLCGYASIKSLGVIKGISDFGDSKKGEDPDAYGDALKNTAFALREWCMHSIPAVNWQPDDDLEPGGLITTGYYDNFIRMILDAYCQGWPVKLKDDPEVTIPQEEIRGLKIVMPKDFKAEFFGEGGSINQVSIRYSLAQVAVGGRNYSRTTHYKAGYFIDFPRTINSLTSYKDSSYQVQAFRRVLQKKPYFVSLVGTPLAEICTWEKFSDWLEVVRKEDASQKAEEVARKVAFEEAIHSDRDEKALSVSDDESMRINRTRVAENEMVMRHIKQEPHNDSISTWDRKSLTSQQSWTISDGMTNVQDDDNDDDENAFEPPPGPPPPKVPLGWKPVWNNQYNEYCFVNMYTRKARWQLPTQPAAPRGESPSPFLRREHTSPESKSDKASIKGFNKRNTS